MTMAEMKTSNFSENEIAENENENKNTTKSSKFRVTIEPALFMGVTAMYVTYLSKQNLLLDRYDHSIQHTSEKERGYH